MLKAQESARIEQIVCGLKVLIIKIVSTGLAPGGRTLIYFQC